MVQNAKPSTVFKQTYRDYLEIVKKIDFRKKKDVAGIQKEGADLVIPFFDSFMRFTDTGFSDPAGHTPKFEVSVVLFRYLIMCPDLPPVKGDWTAFRDFPDAGPLTVFWRDNVENPIASSFTGRLSQLKDRCIKTGFKKPDISVSYDLALCIDALPRIPMLFLFNDAEENFPATASVLFQKDAIHYLDGESLAILGGIFAARIMENNSR